PYRQSTLTSRKNQKLAAKYFGPFEVLERVDSMAYKLKLPVESKLHPVFHVFTLKPYHVGNVDFETVLPPAARKIEVLVHWSQSSLTDASWEKVQDIQDRYLHFKLEDKLSKGTGSIDTKLLQVYTRHTHSQKKQPRVQPTEDGEAVRIEG
ncbi:hypothetical protein MANES_15G181430v8, partial [Manihot esculenta]